MASSSTLNPPRPPPGFRSLKVSSGEILLNLTVSNKCGQAFRWRGVAVWDRRDHSAVPKAGVKMKLGEGSGVIESESEEECIKAEPEIKAEFPASQEDVKPDVKDGSSESESKVDSKAVVKDEMNSSNTEWSLCLEDRVVLLRQDPSAGYLYFKALNHPNSEIKEAELLDSTEVWLRDYLNLKVPLDEMYKEWAAKDKVFERFATRFTGIRMLRQDPWECLCAFICSSNNNIARIGQMVQKLATNYSDPILSHTYPPGPPTSPKLEDEVTPISNTITYHPFPPPSRLAQPGVEEELRVLGFGYRAKYIYNTAKMLCEENSVKFKKDQEEKERIRLEKKGKGKGKRNELEMLSPAPSVSTSTSEIEETSGRGKRIRASTTSITAVSVPVPKKGKGKGKALETPSQTPTPAPIMKPEPVDYGSETDSRVYEFLESLRKMTYLEARERLLTFQGVGPKVSDCILLMSLDQPSSIPVDRHVFAFASKWYGIKTTRYEEVAESFRKLWGDWAGWAHSVIFTADLRAFQDYQPEAKKEKVDELTLESGEIEDKVKIEEEGELEVVAKKGRARAKAAGAV